MEGKVSTMKAQKDELDRGIEGLNQARNGVSIGKKGMQQGKSKMQTAQNEMASGRSKLVSAHKDLQTAYNDLDETISQTKEVRDAIPGMFDEAEANYLPANPEQRLQRHGCLCCNLRHNRMFAAYPLSQESP